MEGAKAQITKTMAPDPRRIAQIDAIIQITVYHEVGGVGMYVSATERWKCGS